MTWPTSNPVSRELDDFWKNSQSLIQQWWYEADLDTKMMSGQQDYWNTFYNGNYRNQKTLMFNKILRIKNMIEGYQRDNRLASIVVPGDHDFDQGQTTDDLTTILDWVTRKDGTYERISDTFGAAITCGFNLMHIYMDFREDPENGEIKSERIPFSAFICDPYWVKSDFSDCNRVWTRKYLTDRQLLSIFPKIEKDLPSLGGGYASKDGKFQFLAQNWSQYQEKMYAYDEYWTRDYRTGRKLLDRNTGEVADWHGTREQFQMLRRINPNVQMIKARIPTIKLHTLVNGHVVHEEQRPWGLDRMPFVPFTCYHFSEVQNFSYRYQGIVRNIRDSQIEINRRRNRLLDVLDAQAQSGIIVKEDALVNPEDAFLQGPGRVLFMKNSSNMATDIQPIPPPPVAPGWMELIQTIEKEIMDIVGPEELFAQNLGNKDMSGVLLKLKMGAGLTGLRNIFDSLNQSQMLLSEIQMDLVVNNFSSGKIQAILGREPSQIIKEATDPQNQMKGISKQFLKYGCAVEEAELTSTQRQLQFMQAVQLKQMGIAIPDKYILDKSTLQGKKELMEYIQQAEQQQQQMQMQAAQAEVKQSQMLSNSLEAKAQSDIALAVERRAKAVADLSLAKHHEALAQEDVAKTALDNAKAFKELEGMDEDRLMKLAKYILELQQSQASLAGIQAGESLETSLGLSQKVESDKLQSQSGQPPQQQQQASQGMLS